MLVYIMTLWFHLDALRNQNSGCLSEGFGWEIWGDSWDIDHLTWFSFYLHVCIKFVKFVWVMIYTLSVLLYLNKKEIYTCIYVTKDFLISAILIL